MITVNPLNSRQRSGVYYLRITETVSQPWFRTQLPCKSIANQFDAQKENTGALLRAAWVTPPGVDGLV
jgi:hypothetical protein